MPNLVVLFGPPASGKATVGHVLAQRLGYRFFHNHLTADPVAALFGWGTPRFGSVVDRVRDLLFREAAADASIPGVVFTFVWSIDLPGHADFAQRTACLFEEQGGRVFFVELRASLQARIEREGTPFRARLKPNQGDVEAARTRQVEFDRLHRMNTDDALPIAWPHLVVDTEAMDPGAAARHIQEALGLAGVADAA
jgi:cytidylate kinase